MLHASSHPVLVAITALASATLAHATPIEAPARLPASPAPDETRADEAALRAIAKHWSRAEAEGDVAYLGELLAPEYRSVGNNGESLLRAALLEHAQRRQQSAEARAERRKASEAFLRTHPTEPAVTIHGAVGIVSYYNPTRGVDHSVRGSDVFVYEANRWRAIYSLHNGAE